MAHPVAFARVSAAGEFVTVFGNIAAMYDAADGVYRIAVKGEEGEPIGPLTALVSPIGGTAHTAAIANLDSDIVVVLRDAAGAVVEGDFSIVVFRGFIVIEPPSPL